MKTVTFYGLDDVGRNKALGTIGHDGKQLVANPPDDPMLLEILGEKLFDPKSRKAISPKDQPEEWLAALRFTFRSSHLRATEPVEA